MNVKVEQQGLLLEDCDAIPVSARQDRDKMTEV